MKESKHASVDLAAPDAQRALRAFSEPSRVGSEQHAHGAPPLHAREAFEDAWSMAMGDGWIERADENGQGDRLSYCEGRTRDAWWGWRARSQVAVPEGMAQWLPIETAPKDGTWFLAYRVLRHSTHIQSAHWHTDAVFGRKKVLGGEGWCYSESEGFPTHWMPLPPAPSASLPGSAGVLPNDALDAAAFRAMVKYGMTVMVDAEGWEVIAIWYTGLLEKEQVPKDGGKLEAARRAINRLIPRIDAALAATNGKQ